MCFLSILKFLQNRIELYFLAGLANNEASNTGFKSIEEVSMTIFPPPIGLGVSTVKGKNNPSMDL